MMVPPQSSEQLKASVRAHWESEACGTRELDTGIRAAFFAQLERERYLYESYIPEFANFKSARGARVLEIGIGAGTDFIQWSRNGAHATGVDLTAAGTRLSAERLALEGFTARLCQGDAEVLPFGAEQFDIVYSWGVLHHTGAMWRALEHAARPVRPGGQLFIAIYNDTGSQSARWKRIKHTYTRLPRPLRVPFALAVSAPEELKSLARAVAAGRPGDYIRSWSMYDRSRGMSHWHDIVDWVGGYPYEYAKPDAIFAFFKARGFVLDNLRMGGGLGCSEYVFRRPRSTE